MVGAVIWQLKAFGQPTVRCAMKRLRDGRYRLRLLKEKQSSPLMEHDYSDRQAALQSSILIYRKLKDFGFDDTRPPALDLAVKI